MKQDVPHFLSVRGPDVRNLVSRQESSFGGPSSKMYCNCCEREITPPTENHYSEETQKLKQQQMIYRHGDSERKSYQVVKLRIRPHVLITLLLTFF